MAKADQLKPLLKNFMDYLIDGTFLMVDIGSNGGITAKPEKILYACDGTRYMYCDPRDNISNEQQLIEISAKDIVVNKAISVANETKTFYLTQKGQVSSLQEPNIAEISKFDNPARFGVKERTSIPCTTLSDVIHAYGHPIDYLKIDVQGHEAYIVDQENELLRNSSPWIMIEMNNKMYYHGQETFWGLGRKLDLLGYEVIDIFPKYVNYSLRSDPDSQCRVFTFADVLWKKKELSRLTDSLKRELMRYTAFGKLFTKECLLLVNELKDPVINNFVRNLHSFYASGMAESQSEYIV